MKCYLFTKEAYLGPRQKSNMELFAKIFLCFRRLTISVKSSILDIGPGSEYASADSHSLLIFSKNEAANLFAD